MTNNKNQGYGYQPGGSQQRGYQPTNPGNGYQPSRSGTGTQPSPKPPSSGTAIKKS